MRTFAALLVLIACASASPFIGGGYGGYGGYGYGGYGYPGYGVGVAEVIAEPVIPLASGVVDVRGYVDSYTPGSSYTGYGTYGPAYGGLGYPLEVYGIGAGCGGPVYGAAFY